MLVGMLGGMLGNAVRNAGVCGMLAECWAGPRNAGVGPCNVAMLTMLECWGRAMLTT